MHVNRKFIPLLLALIFAIPRIAEAQVSNTNSPYSFSGLGQLNYQGFAAQRATGNVGRAMREKNTFSFTNPAGYSALEFTDFEFSASYYSVSQTSEVQDREYNMGSFDYIALGFPIIENKLGMAFGLIPYANTGYLMTERVVEDDNDVEYRYEGTGAINRIYLGLGMEVIQGLSVGVNAEYDFGNIRSNTDKRYVGSSELYSFQDIDDTRYRGLGLSGGVQYTVRTKRGIQSTLGATVNLGRNIMAENHQIFRTYNAQGKFIIDTLIDRSFPEVDLEVPLGYGIGLQTGKANRWGLGVEYTSQAWSSFEDISGISNFNDVVSYSAGGYFQLMDPTVDRTGMSKFGGFMKTWRIYAGIRYEQGYLRFNNQPIDEIGIGFGLGIPLVKKMTLSSGSVPIISMLNITAEWIERGTTDNELIREDILRISIGLNFNDKWFIKRKFQ